MADRLSGRAVAAYKGMQYLKFAATVNQEGAPNVVPLLSARMVDPGTVAFVRFMVWKTARNFESNGKITFACAGPRSRSYVVKGEFQEWMSEGPLLEEFEAEPLYRYNAYMGANQLGIVKVREVLEYPGAGMVMPIISALFWKLFRGKSAQSAAAGGGPMPAQVIDKFARPLSAKFVGMVDDQGDPMAFPMQALDARDAKEVTFPLPKEPSHPLRQLKDGDLLAASVMTLDPSAYQVKGRFSGPGASGGKSRASIRVSEVYTAAPPVPGRRIYPAE
jgi:predicted pyridoxine 5'-phosphate oxidase superfamily flavin-nucleotide-binding protein